MGDLYPSNRCEVKLGLDVQGRPRLDWLEQFRLAIGLTGLSRVHWKIGRQIHVVSVSDRWIEPKRLVAAKGEIRNCGRDFVG